MYKKYLDQPSTDFLSAHNFASGLQLDVQAGRALSWTSITVGIAAGIGIVLVISYLLYVHSQNDGDKHDPTSSTDSTSKPSTGKSLQSPRGVAKSASPPKSFFKRMLSTENPTADAGAADAESDVPALHFSNSEYMAERSGGSVVIRLRRVGKLDKQSRVAYTTRDLTGRAGKEYTATSGTLVFEEGASMKQFEVQLLASDFFHQPRTFQVELLDEGLQNAQISSQISKARVTVVDQKNFFPSNEFKDNIQSGNYAVIDKRRLLTAYCYYTFMSNDEVRIATIKHIIIDQLDNIKVGWGLILTLYMVDRVLNRNVEDEKIFFQDRRKCLGAIVLAMVVPEVLMFLAKAHQATLGVHSLARNYLQQTVMAQFQSYDHETAVNEVKDGLFMISLFNDTSNAVSNGYMKFLSIVKLLGRGVVMIMFMTVIPYFLPDMRGKGKKIGYVGTITVFALPIFLLILFLVTHRHVMALISNGFKKYSKTIHASTQCVENHRLIREYKQMHYWRTRFHKVLDEASHAAGELSIAIGLQASAATWISAILVSLLTWNSGRRVLAGNMAVGMMMADITALHSIGTAYHRIFDNVVKMQTSLGSLMRVTKYMNMNTGLTNVMKFRASVEDTTMDWEKQQLSQGQIHDEFPIVIPGCRINRANGQKIVISTKLEIQQGQVVVFMGEGAESLLKMMDVEQLGDEMDVLGVPFVPSHLRTLVVKREPMFLDGTLLSNLVLGNDEATLEEVTSVCTELGVSEDTMTLLASSEEKNSYQWKSALSAEEKEILTLARAFVARPHLLCFECPGTILEDKLTRNSMSMARKFVDTRGGGMRPRTVLMTAYQADDLDLADKIYHVSPDKGLRQVTLRELRSLGYN